MSVKNNCIDANDVLIKVSPKVAPRYERDKEGVNSFQHRNETVFLASDQATETNIIFVKEKKDHQSSKKKTLVPKSNDKSACSEQDKPLSAFGNQDTQNLSGTCLKTNKLNGITKHDQHLSDSDEPVKDTALDRQSEEPLALEKNKKENKKQSLYKDETIIYETKGQKMTCWCCQEDIVTRTEWKVGHLTHMMAICMCMLGCWFLCCLIPYVARPCKDVIHFCPKCGRRLGIYTRV